MTFGFARKFISRLESFLPIDPDKEHRHLPLLISSRHCVSSEFMTRFCSLASQTLNSTVRVWENCIARFVSA